MAHTPTARVEAVRRFNRFYTRHIGLLEEGFLKTPFPLSEARLIYELAHHEETTASHLAQELGLDSGYMSRLVATLHHRGLIEKRVSNEDRRQQILTLSDEGQKAFAQLNAASRTAIEETLESLEEEEQGRLLQGMDTIERLLGAETEHRVPFILRPFQSGDLGWVVQRHGVLYNREYGWNETFEALVARIVADFIESYEPSRERCWIAEREGENVGSVFLVRHREREGVAKLRLLLVEPHGRGLGIGRRLVQECIRFARQTGYHTVTLWTNSVLEAAARIYETEGFKVVHEEAHHSFGHDLVGQTWELEL